MLRKLCWFRGMQGVSVLGEELSACRGLVALSIPSCCQV
jgi:hypothetical protein